MAGPRIAIRLGTEGSSEVRNDFAGIKVEGKSSFDAVGAAAEASANRASRAYDRATADVETAMRRQAAAAARVAAVTPQTATQQRINAAVGIGNTAGSAKVSAAAIQELIRAEEQLERRTIALRSALDPLFAAQQRYNGEVREAKMLLDAGRISMDLYAQAELRAKTALDAATAAQTRNNAASSRSRMAMQQLGFQISDVTTSLAGGINPAMVFAQQSGQVAYALSLMEGKAGLVGRVLAGPWGAALGAGVTALALFATRSKDAANATDDQKAATVTLADAIKDLDAATRNSFAPSDAALRQSIATAEAKRREAIATREATLAKIEDQKALLEANVRRASGPGYNAEMVGLGLAGQQGRITELEQQAKAQQVAIADANRALADSRMTLLLRDVEVATSKVAVATRTYEATLANLRRQYQAGKITDEEFRQGMIDATQTREKASAADSKGASSRSELAKAAREAAAAERELGSTLAALVGRFDPATASARAYADQLRDIAKLRAANVIDDSMARRLRLGADNALEQSRRDAGEGQLSPGLLATGRKPLADLTRIVDLDAGATKAREKLKALQAQGAELFDRVLSPDSWRDWGAAGLRAIDAIKQELFTLAVLNPIKNLLFNSGAPTLAGIGNIAKAVGRNASGTEYWSGGATWLAENGPEIVSLPRGARVTPASQTRQLLREQASAAAPSFHFDLRGAVVTDDLLRQMNAIGEQAAVRGAAGGSRLAQADMVRNARRRIS